jgi:hypothetical protein
MSQTRISNCSRSGLVSKSDLVFVLKQRKVSSILELGSEKNDHKINFKLFHFSHCGKMALLVYLLFPNLVEILDE